MLNLDCGVTFCSGNGDCATQSDGRNLVMTGCTCDEGWGGTNCSTTVCMVSYYTILIYHY